MLFHVHKALHLGAAELFTHGAVRIVVPCDEDDAQKDQCEKAEHRKRHPQHPVRRFADVGSVQKRSEQNGAQNRYRGQHDVQRKSSAESNGQLPAVRAYLHSVGDPVPTFRTVSHVVSPHSSDVDILYSFCQKNTRLIIDIGGNRE